MISKNSSIIINHLSAVGFILMGCLLLLSNNSWAGVENINQVTVTNMKTPPFIYFSSIKGKEGNEFISLKEIKSAPNNRTDRKKWLSENDLSLPLMDVPNPFFNEKGSIPNYVPATYRGNILVKAINDAKFLYLIYGKDFNDGRYLFVMSRETKQFEHGFY